MSNKKAIQVTGNSVVVAKSKKNKFPSLEEFKKQIFTQPASLRRQGK